MVDKRFLLLSLMDLKKSLKILLGSWFGPSFLYFTTNSNLFIKKGFHFWDNVAFFASVISIIAAINLASWYESVM